MSCSPTFALTLLMSTSIFIIGAPEWAAAQTQEAVADAPIDPPLEAAGPVNDGQYSPAYQACLHPATSSAPVERCAQDELDRQIRRLDAAFHQSLVVAPDDDRRSGLQGRQAAWISISNGRCFGDLRNGDAASRERGLNCLITATILRRVAIEHELGR